MIDTGTTLVTVERVLSQLEKGSIFSGRQENGELIRVKLSGIDLAPEVGATYSVQGLFQTYSNKYNKTFRQFTVSKITRVVAVGALLIPFLERLPNVGPTRAKRLLEVFGDDLAQALTDPDRLGEVAKALDPTKPVLASKIAAQVFAAMTHKAEEDNSARAEVEFLAMLEKAGVTKSGAARQLWRLVGGTGSQERLLKNPYLAASILDWKSADHLGKNLLKQAAPKADFKDHPHRLLGAVDSVWRELLGDGDSASEEEPFVALLHRRGVDPNLALGLARKKGTVTEFEALLRAPGAAYIENSLANRLLDIEQAVCPINIPDAIRIMELVNQAEADTGLKLFQEQRDAVVTLIKRPVALLQGGAGVGKTTVMKVLAAVWERLGGNVVLGALAGKAALGLARGASSPGQPRLGYTVARLINMQAASCDGKPPSADRVIFDDRTLIVLDEASMLDTPGLHELLSYHPIGARLLLAGDHGQLPPVGWGCVFHDLVNDGSRLTNLTTVRRQLSGSPIPLAAAAIRDGNVPHIDDWRGVGAGIFVVPKGRDHVAQYQELLALTPDTMVIAARRSTVDAFNYNAAHRIRDVNLPVVRLGPLATVAVGDPIVCTRNRYRDGLFNGLLGKVKGIDADLNILVLWDGEDEPRLLDKDAAQDCELAYGITCHRAQGSAAKMVMVILENTPLVTREWLYTAITRAREGVVIIGDMGELEKAVGRRTKRTTGFHAWK
jgi:exodeoxyribonuclease V alpha subunit